MAAPVATPAQTSHADRCVLKCRTVHQSATQASNVKPVVALLVIGYKRVPHAPVTVAMQINGRKCNFRPRVASLATATATPKIANLHTVSQIRAATRVVPKKEKTAAIM